MYSTREDDHLVFKHKLSSGDYLFVYSASENNVVGLIHPTPDSVDTPEAYTKDEDVVDTTGDDMLEALGLKNGNIFDDSDSSCGE